MPRPQRLAYGQLNCVQIDGGPEPDTLVVALHGFGAPGEDLVSLAAEYIAKLGDVAERVRFVFPAALKSLDEMGMPGGRAWWPLNMAKLMEAVEARDISEMRAHEPPGLSEARRAVVDAIKAMVDDLGIGYGRLILGGFSQGAMLATDVAIRGLRKPPAGLFLYSGTLICESEWSAEAVRLSATDTVQSHGSFDPILPIEGAEALHQLLKTAGVPIQYIPFGGPHTITLQAIEATADLISFVANKQAG